MRLAIADPPYLGRAHRWYGGGRGTAGGRHHAPTVHPEARDWDDPSRHRQLVKELDDGFDGWAIAAHAASLAVYLSAAPDAHVLVWHMTNAAPSGSRLHNRWEPVIVRMPPGRTSRTAGMRVGDVLTAAAPRIGHVGAKPREWTLWVLAVMGYDPAVDELVDLFPGSGAVSDASAVLL